MKDVNGTEKGHKGREGKGKRFSKDVSKTGGARQGREVKESTKTTNIPLKNRHDQ